jgi:hypothetical protein
MELPRDGRVVPGHVQLLLDNRQALVDKFGLPYALYTPPSRDHYPHLWNWDEKKIDIVFAREGFTREAITGFFSLMSCLRPNGRLPSMIFAPKGRKIDPERYSFIHPFESSDYTQPAMEALAAHEIYKSLLKEDERQARLFLESAFPLLDRSYGYFPNYRQNGPSDPKIGIIHPHETGRDSDPTFDFMKLRLDRNGKDTNQLINLINSGTDYASVIALNYKQRLVGWDERKARQNFWVNDVMFNCIYVDNLYEMATLAEELGRGDDAAQYRKLAEGVEKRILDDMWFGADDGQGKFYALKDDTPIIETSVSNLFPLTMPNLRPNQLASILDQLETSFNTDYPIPSVPKDSPNYDSAYREKGRIWRGPTWIDMNWYLVERGLQMQAVRTELQQAYPDLVRRCTEFGNKVVAATQVMLNQGYWEFYNPETAEPYRVEHFAWSTIGRLLAPMELALSA